MSPSWFSKAPSSQRSGMSRRPFYRSGMYNTREGRAEHAFNLRQGVNYSSFEASRNGRGAYLQQKRVNYIGWADWCRLTRNVPPSKWVSVKQYGFRGNDGNLYKLQRRY